MPHLHIITASLQVSFTLHNSFAKPLREFTAPPFEVREDGWGEFDVQIRVRYTLRAFATLHAPRADCRHACRLLVSFALICSRAPCWVSIEATWH